MKICVFCGSRAGDDPIYEEKAKEFAQEMVKNQLNLVYGAGNVGLMGIIADEVMKQGGKAEGYIPFFLADKEVAHTGLDKLEKVETMHQRKQLMADEADGFVALPGGMGTMDELCEIVTWAQLRLHHKPIGVLNINGYFDHLMLLMDNMVEKGFLSKQDRGIIIFSEDPQELLSKIQEKFLSYDEKIIGA